MEFPVFSPKPYSNTVYRNIFTNTRGENILDDIGEESDFETIDAAIQLTSGIDHSLPQFHRPFQYGKIDDEEILAVFKKENWGVGRFGDGREYGVWYGAEDEVTTVYEACWVTFLLAKDNTVRRGEVYTADRAMYRADIETSKMADFVGIAQRDIFTSLIHPTDHSYCRSLGQHLVSHSVDLARMPSARRREGICTPIFSPNPIRDASRVYYLKIHVNPDLTAGIESSQEELNFSMAVNRLENPHGVDLI